MNRLNGQNAHKYKVLLTNDDGFYAEGLQVLAAALEEVADVYILAPESNRSGVSSHIEMREPLTVTKIAENRFTSSGHPADCVIGAMRSDLFGDVKFDAVIAGINRGPNMGTDCIYSGTIAAARQAVLYGVPGIALSVKSPGGDYADGGYNYSGMAHFVKKNLAVLISLYEKDCVVSVNAKSAEKYDAVKFTKLCSRDYKDRIELEEKNDGTLKSTFLGGELTTDGPDCSEHDAVDSGLVAITRVRAAPVDFESSAERFADFVF